MLQRRSIKLMGNAFEFAIQSDDKTWANVQNRLSHNRDTTHRKLLTTFSEDSVTHQINKQAGIKPVVVPEEVFQLINRCQRISELTQGSFDISLWQF